jgi:hypothetical protein
MGSRCVSTPTVVQSRWHGPFCLAAPPCVCVCVFVCVCVCVCVRARARVCVCVFAARHQHAFVTTHVHKYRVSLVSFHHSPCVDHLCASPQYFASPPRLARSPIASSGGRRAARLCQRQVRHDDQEQPKHNAQIVAGLGQRQRAHVFWPREARVVERDVEWWC